MELRFLGTGCSSGSPVLGCRCPVCRSSSVKNRRYRPALLVQTHGKTILIDAPQELRLQLLSAKATALHALFITHCHADHVFGLDDVRIFSREKKLPVYANGETLKELKSIFPYVFKRTQKSGGKPRLHLQKVEAPFRVFGLSVVPIPVVHGNKKILGWRLGAVAYLPDVSRIPSTSLPLLQGLQVLILDALRNEPHPTHLTLKDAIRLACVIGAKKTFFTHISHHLDHLKTERALPKGMHLAYDGLVVKVLDHGKDASWRSVNGGF